MGSVDPDVMVWGIGQVWTQTSAEIATQEFTLLGTSSMPGPGSSIQGNRKGMQSAPHEMACSQEGIWLPAGLPKHPMQRQGELKGCPKLPGDEKLFHPTWRKCQTVFPGTSPPIPCLSFFWGGKWSTLWYEAGM